MIFQKSPRKCVSHRVNIFFVLAQKISVIVIDIEQVAPVNTSVVDMVILSKLKLSHGNIFFVTHPNPVRVLNPDRVRVEGSC